MPKISVYLGNVGGIDYSDEIRREYDVSDFSQDTVSKIKNKFIEDFGSKWNMLVRRSVLTEFKKESIVTAIIRKRKPSGLLTVKISREGKKPLVVVKDYKMLSGRIILTHTAMPPRKYTEEQDSFILRNYSGRKTRWRTVAMAYERIFKEKRTATALFNRAARLQKRKMHKKKSEVI
jgi:hypothetical protein